MSQVPHAVFRAYDVRGIVGPDINTAFAKLLGQAIGTTAVRQGRSALTVGRDCRTHSPELHSGLVAGLRSTGIEVVDLGVVPTPLVYFSTFFLADDVISVDDSKQSAPHGKAAICNKRVHSFQKYPFQLNIQDRLAQRRAFQ